MNIRLHRSSELMTVVGTVAPCICAISLLKRHLVLVASGVLTNNNGFYTSLNDACRDGRLGQLESAPLYH